MTDKAFSTRALAERWDCTEAHIRGMIRGGAIKAFRLGTLWRIKLEEVERIECGSSNTEEHGALSGMTEKQPAARPFVPRTVPLLNSASKAS
ncbi:helix-turn-helix domain-containing protein [Micavibrio aeruginosavorus]|uniref:Uncharacterized domain protein n=1 Tax=Micavibrio aeruginosavorus (strain ARL-13) TaxID=856793 RepID=G2KN04_MICAA|nr:helix-turn-helix domain-containing protein [Micavibrio aeruginosavorus]AEP08936.1 putative uncharacterized domain protein [Micavibrio aeruginosavorus ARL-13]